MSSRLMVMFLLAALVLVSGCARTVSPLAEEHHRFLAQIKPVEGTVDQALVQAKYYRIAGRLDQAAALLEGALQQHPDNTKLLNGLGSLYDQMGAYQRAQEIYGKILALEPDNAVALNNLGYSYYLAGDYGRAEKTLQDLLAKYPENAVARNNLGLVWCRQGRNEEALALWEKKDGPTAAQEKLQAVLALLARGQNHQGPVQELSASRPAAVPSPQPPLEERAAAERDQVQEAAPPAAGQGQIQAAKASAHSNREATPPVKVEEVTMIVQKAAASAPVVDRAPRQPRLLTVQPASIPPAAAALEAAEADPQELEEVATTPPRGQGRNTGQVRLLPAAAPAESPPVKPVREYLPGFHEHQIHRPGVQPTELVF